MGQKDEVNDLENRLARLEVKMEHIEGFKC
jgi:hypothetical protein